MYLFAPGNHYFLAQHIRFCCCHLYFPESYYVTLLWLSRHLAALLCLPHQHIMHQWLLWLLWLHWYCCALVLVLVLVLIKSLLISMLLCSGLLSSFIILPSLCVNTIPLYFLDALQALAIQPKYFVLFVFQSVDSKSSSYLVHCLSDIAQLLWTFWVELSCYVVHSLAHMPLIIICNVYCSCILIWLICYMEECIWSLSGKRFNQPQYVSEAVFWKSMCWQLLLLSPYPSQCIFPHWDKFISSCNICVYAL